MPDSISAIRAARVVLPCTELDDTLRFFTDRLGFRVDAISPADDPRTVVLSGHGLRIELQRGLVGSPGILRLTGGTAGETLVAPNGTRIEREGEPALVVPPLQPSLVVTREQGEPAGVVGRAGMRYRDLLPGRQGGRFVASRIQIADGGPVPDYVHFHDIRFQLIHCTRGWVRVVYEDQGPPFVMEPGDCVLQPPRIRHRVLESSPGLEVVEVGCPAEHPTIADHTLGLPTSVLRPDRDFGGQRFVRHVAATAVWQAGDGCEWQDTGIGAATSGLVDVRVVRSSGRRAVDFDGELLFRYVLAGVLTVERDGGTEILGAGDSIAVPAGMTHVVAGSAEWLEIYL